MSAIFTIEDNIDYMGGNFYSFSFFRNEEELNAYLKQMMCWSGHISVVEKIPLHQLGSRIDDIYTKYQFSEDAKDEVKRLYREYAEDEVDNYLNN